MKRAALNCTRCTTRILHLRFNCIMPGKIISLLFMSIAVALIGCGEAKQPATVELKLVDWPGVEKVLASHRGKIVVLDAWSTSCEPCMQEFPNLVAFAKKHAGKVACVSLSLDYEGLGKPEDKREQVLKFLREQNATIDNLLGTEDSESMMRHLKVGSIPAIFIYDRTGKLAETLDTHVNYQEVEKKIQPLLGT